MEKILITGATGYLGSLYTKYCLNRGLEVYALFRNEEKKNRIFGVDTQNLHFIKGDITDTFSMNKLKNELRDDIGELDYLVHFAANTVSAVMMSNPVETADGIVLGTRNMLDLARELSVRSMVYISSMEVYGGIQPKDASERTIEAQLGAVDLSNPRSCYPLGKRMAEHYCQCFYREYGVHVKIARPAQCFGRDVLADDNRVFAQFARAVMSGTDIVLHTEGKSVGNYVDADDCMEAIEIILLHGVDGEAYNIVNEQNTMSIFQMAELVSSSFSGGKSKVVFDIPENNLYGYPKETEIRLSGKKLETLGWHPTCTLLQMYEKLLRDYNTIE